MLYSVVLVMILFKTLSGQRESQQPLWGVTRDRLLLGTCRTSDESAKFCELEREIYLQLDFSENFALVLRYLFKE